MDLNQAEQYVKSNPNSFWEGWYLKVFEPSSNAWMKPNGSMRNGRWGIVHTVGPDERGMYNIK